MPNVTHKHKCSIIKLKKQATVTDAQANLSTNILFYIKILESTGLRFSCFCLFIWMKTGFMKL